MKFLLKMVKLNLMKLKIFFFFVVGYMPEWILIEKQIRESIEQARINLKCIFKRLASENFQSSNEQKIDLSNHIQWLQALEKFHNEITEINNNIDKLNLIVPMLWRQQVLIFF